VILGASVLAAAPVLSVPATGASPQSRTQASKKPSPAKNTTPKKKTTRRSRARGQQAPSGDRIREIQEALAREGHYQGTPTGKFDPVTVAALKSFQQANGFNATGKLDARTLQKLGLGSETAGLAPPRAAPVGAEEPPARQ
jgi:peptidoglycan hydrolase-like protein with peptidoglycan-binding domain